MCDAAWHSRYYSMASYLNTNPEALPVFLDEVDSLGSIVNIFGMLKPEVRALAIKIASRLIMNIARQIADTGYRSGHLELINGFIGGSDIELDRTLENYVERPDAGILDNIASYARKREKAAFLLILDSSYSMRGLKIILGAITAASIAYQFKRDYAILSFSDKVSVLKAVDENIGAEKLLERLFSLELRGATDIRRGLEMGLEQVSGFERKTGLILTDGAWNRGGDPRQVVGKFDKLSVIAFTPANEDKVRELAFRGNLSFVEGAGGIAGAIVRCLT